MLLQQAFVFRLRERPGQAASFRRYVGSCRFVWNRALDYQRTLRQEGGKLPGYAELCARLPDWKREFPWLADAPSQPLQQTLKDLMRAWDRFFDAIKSGRPVAPEDPARRRQLRLLGVKLAYPPRFKSRGDKDGIRFPQGFQIDEANARIKLPKLGWMRYRKSQDLKGVARNITVSHDILGWHVSIQTEREASPLPVSTRIGAGDRGVNSFLALDDGTLVEPLNAHKVALSRLRRYQRSCSRKVEMQKRVLGISGPIPKEIRLPVSNRLKRARDRLSRYSARVARMRQDWLHKLSTGLAKDHAAFVLEDLRVTNMTKSAKGDATSPGKNVRAKSGLNRSILDQGWGEFARQLQYKLEWRGGQLVLINPRNTSRTCHACGHTDEKNRKGQTFKCLACGNEDHADINAAKNILAAGHAVLGGEGKPGSSHADVEDTVQSGRPMKRQPASARRNG